MNTMGKAAAVHDSDLEDLLNSATSSDSMEQAPLNLDHLTKGQLDVPSRSSSPSFSVVAYFSAWMSYMCYAHPRLCTCFAMGLVALGMLVLVNLVFNPTISLGDISTDFMGIASKYDHTMGKIDHWCLRGDNDSCRCEDPLEPTSRGEFKTWVKAFHANKNLVEAYRGSDFLDVAFLGESLVEELDGRWLGRTEGDELQHIANNFRKHFKRDNSGMEGVALGIAGDTSPNVLYRLRHGEMPPDFNPRVWWISLGMNDIGRMQCSEEVVILGILRVVEEILTRKPDAEVVINSMLPMADLRGGMYPNTMEYMDAFRQVKGKNANPQLMTRTAGQKVIQYERPVATTKAIRVRAEKKDSQTKLHSAPPQSIRPPIKGKTNPIVSNAGKSRRLKEDEEEPKETSHNQKKDTPITDEKEKKENALYLKRVKKDPVNPRMDSNKKRIKARDASKVFVKASKLPLWTSIHAINEELKKFAKEEERVHFFDATSIFADNEEGNKWILKSQLISVRGHPTEIGFELWQDAIALELKTILETDDAHLVEQDNAKIKKEKENEKSPANDAQQKGNDGKEGRL